MFNIIDIIAAVTVAAIWGGNFLFAKIGLDTLPPFLLLSLRFMLVTILLLPFVKRSTVANKDLILIAVTLGILHHGLLFLAIWLKIDLGASIIIMQSSVPMSTLLGVFLLNEPIDQKTTLGIIVASVGIIIIAGNPHVHGHYIPIILAILSAFSLALFNVQIKILGQFNVLSMIAYSSIFSTIFLSSISVLFEQASYSQLATISISTIISIVYMAFSTIVGFGLWFWLIQRHSIIRIAPFTLLIPVFGLSFSSIFMHQQITIHLIIGSVLTILGIAVILLKNNLGYK